MPRTPCNDASYLKDVCFEWITYLYTAGQLRLRKIDSYYWCPKASGVTDSNASVVAMERIIDASYNVEANAIDICLRIALDSLPFTHVDILFFHE